MRFISCADDKPLPVGDWENDNKFFDAAVACNADYLDFGRTMDLLNHK